MKKDRYMNVSKFVIIIFLLFSLPFTLFSQNTSNDSVSVQPVDSAYMAQIETLIRQAEIQEKIQNAVNEYNENLLKKEMRFEYTNLIPLASGFISIYTRHDFVYNHPSVFEKANSSAQDYAVAASPLVAAWIMKAAGVKSRSTTRRMATANGFALALAAGLTYGTKHLVNEKRPDLSDNHSFPSGHSALVYVGATVLSREFGHVSPWITVGGFSSATAIELLRIKHNAHWLNDIYMGAGIGVISTNFGYWLADRIFGQDGINKPEMRKADLARAMKMYAKPSSFALVASSELGGNTISAENLVFSDDMSRLADNDYHLHLSSGTIVGVEGSWFLNPFLAVEAIAQTSIGQAKVYYTEDMGDMTFTGNMLQMYRGSLAIKGSMPLPGTANRLAIRALGGVRSINKASFFLTDADTYSPKENYSITLPRNTKFELGCGISYDILESKSYIVGFNFDYYHAFSKVIPNRYLLSAFWKVLF